MSKAIKIDMSRASDFKLLDRRAVNTLLDMPEQNAFFRAEREAGVSKWSTRKLIRYAISNIAGYSTAPMQCVTWAGAAFLIFAIVLGIQTLVRYFTGHAVEGFTTVILLVLLTGSIIMISLGVIGYYIARIYEEAKRRPRYIVSRTV